MVLVAGYLVRIDPSFFILTELSAHSISHSSPRFSVFLCHHCSHSQWKASLPLYSLSLLSAPTPLSLTSFPSFLPPVLSVSVAFVFPSLSSFLCLCLSFHHPPVSYFFFSYTHFSTPLLLGMGPVSRCFLIHPHLSLSSLPRLPPSLSLHCPLIFMQLAGQPCSASLSLSVGEQAA